MDIKPDGVAAIEQLRVELVERDDGRYLLYYSWPGVADVDAEAAAQPPPETDV